MHPAGGERGNTRDLQKRGPPRRKLRVEPAARLVGALDDPVLRPPAFEFVIAPRIAEARPARDPAIEPHIDDVGNAMHFTVALFARQYDAVNPGPVEVHAVFVTSAVSQFRGGPDHGPVTALRTPPDREGCAPIPLSGQAPIAEGLRPVELPRGARPVREPRDPTDLFDHLPLH